MGNDEIDAMYSDEISFAVWLGQYQDAGGWDDKSFFCSNAIRFDALLEDYEQGVSAKDAYEANQCSDD